MPVFSFMGNASQHPQQVPCYITHTNEKTHDVIRSNLDRSPMYAGVIEGVGPRYCPSIEDKVMRFAERNQHQIFLEPEGLTSNEIYPNGISTSLPFDVQMQIVRSMQGMENAKIVRPGYAIEYDFFDPRDLKPTLESKFIQGLFFAGQINGTTVTKKPLRKVCWLVLTLPVCLLTKKVGLRRVLRHISAYWLMTCAL